MVNVGVPGILVILGSFGDPVSSALFGLVTGALLVLGAG